MRLVQHSALLVLALAMSSSAMAQEAIHTIRGKAVFKGDPKKFEPKPIEAVEGTECQLGPKLLDESVIINETTPPTLRNVVIWIEEGPIDFRSPEPKAGAVITMTNCRFEPRVTALQARQQLTVRNDDPFKQGIRIESKTNKPRGFTMPKPGMQVNMSFDPDDPIPIHSPIYPWMTGWIVVIKHPYFLITGTDGAFEFHGFPPGKYLLKAWHEKFGQAEASIDVQPGAENAVEFVFEPKADD